MKTMVVLSLVLFVTIGRGWAESSGSSTPGPFDKVDRLGTDLKRGTSSKADVERLLGAPTGRGVTLLPTQNAPRDVWVYQLVRRGKVHHEGSAQGVPLVRVDIKQHFLMVFFEGDRFDGYLWSNWVQPVGTERAR